MQIGYDIARGESLTITTINVATRRGIFPLHNCAACVWRGRGGEDCDDPNGGTDCKCFAANNETQAQGQTLLASLQVAYGMHLSRQGSKRLAWLEGIIDQLHQLIGNRRP